MSSYITSIQTLTIPNDGSRVLLGKKKIRFGAGKWNGFGGKVEQGETIMRAAARELEEEAGIRATSLEPAGIIDLYYEKEGLHIEGHVFTTYSFDGEPTESDEMIPQWFLYKDIPFDSMWVDDRLWFPFFLSKKLFHGEFWFADVDTMIRHTLEEVTQMS